LQEPHHEHEHPWPEQHEQCLGRGVVAPESVPHSEYAQEQPEVGVVVERIEPLAVSEFAIPERVSALVVRVEAWGARARAGS
jgi:hypothetical protein